MDDGWMDGWMEETLQSGRSKLICEQMEIIACIPSSLIKVLAKEQNARGGMCRLE